MAAELQARKVAAGPMVLALFITSYSALVLGASGVATFATIDSVAKLFGLNSYPT